MSTRPSRRELLTRRYQRTIRLARIGAALYALLRVVVAADRWIHHLDLFGDGIFSTALVSPLVSSLVAVYFVVLAALLWRPRLLSKILLVLCLSAIGLAIFEFSATGSGGILEFILGVLAQRGWAASRSEYV